MNGLLIGCLLIPMLTAIASFVYAGSARVRGCISLAGMAMLTAFSVVLLVMVARGGPLSNQMGGWEAPMGITLIADMLSAILVLVTAIVGLTVTCYALTDISEERSSGGFFSFLNMLIAGVVGAFLTGDLFNLYVWFEVMLISSFALLVLGGDKVQLDGAVKYVAINLISTVLFLASIGLLYGLTGTLNMADLYQKVPLVENQALVSVVAVMFLLAFGIKAAIFPLYFWLPASYHTLPISIAAVFAALMTKVGVYALIRTFTLIFPGDHSYIQLTLLIVALITMILGVLGAITHTDIRRILAFHVIGSIGFMLLGLGLGSELAMTAAIFYMVHGILVKALLFMLAGMIGHIGGSYELSRLGGLYRMKPGFSIVFLLAALSLIGIPPLSGFWAKVMIVEASLAEQAVTALAIVVAASLLTFIPIIRIWSEAFWKAAPEGSELRKPLLLAWVPVVGLSLLLLWVGFLPGTLISGAEIAAATLMAPQSYIDAVLSGSDALAFTGYTQ
ncbi:MAG: Na+/H+ antiporter subunit D [Granulosicoccus sp.]